MSGASQSDDAGFTLVEMLVALFVFSILSAATVAAMTNTFQTRRLVNANLERVEDIAAFDQILRDDFANLITRPTRDAYGTRELVSFQTYAPDGALIRFTRQGRSNPGGVAARGDTMRITYRVVDDQLVRETPSLPTPAINTPTLSRVLVDDVRRVDITAYRAGRETLQVNVAPESPDLPDHIRFDIETETGTLTHVVGVGS